MRRKTRTKVGKTLKVIGIISAIIAIIIGIIVAVKINQDTQISYEDTLVGKNLFEEITINLKTKQVKRDKIETTLVEEFGISEEEENLYLNSEEELNNFLSQGTFDISNNLRRIYNKKSFSN